MFVIIVRIYWMLKSCLKLLCYILQRKMFEYYSWKGKSPNLPNLTFIFLNIFFRNKKERKKNHRLAEKIFFWKIFGFKGYSILNQLFEWKMSLHDYFKPNTEKSLKKTVQIASTEQNLTSVEEKNVNREIAATFNSNNNKKG